MYVKHASLLGGISGNDNFFDVWDGKERVLVNIER